MDRAFFSARRMHAPAGALINRLFSKVVPSNAYITIVYYYNILLYHIIVVYHHTVLVQYSSVVYYSLGVEDRAAP